MAVTRSRQITRAVVLCALTLALGASTAAAQRPAGPPVPAQPPSPAMQDSINMMMGMVGPMFGNMMTSMFEGMLAVLERPETAERMATFTRNYFDALVRRGFTREEALRIVATAGLPSMGGPR